MDCTCGLEGDKFNALTCRPVSLTSITCKLLEHVIYSNVIAHFDSYEDHPISSVNDHIKQNLFLLDVFQPSSHVT